MNRFYNQSGKESFDRFRHSAFSLFSFQSASLAWYKKHFVFPCFSLSPQQIKTTGTLEISPLAEKNFFRSAVSFRQKAFFFS